MSELIVDFITSLDAYASAEGWPGWWGLQGPEYLAWLDKRLERDYTLLMGTNTYRLMYGFASASEASDSDKTAEDGAMADSPDYARWCFLNTGGPVVLGQYPARQRGCRGSRGSD